MITPTRSWAGVPTDQCATNNMYGGHRPGDNLRSSSIVCLDRHRRARLALSDRPSRPLRLGQPDGAHPDGHHSGRQADQGGRPGDETSVGVRLRSGHRKAGVAYRRASCAASQCAWRKAAATKPFPTKPAPYDRQGVTVDDLIDFTPELRAEAEEIAKKFVLGPLFTPPSTAGAGPAGTLGTLQMPGQVGGSNWLAEDSIRRRACSTCRRSLARLTFC